MDNETKKEQPEAVATEKPCSFCDRGREEIGFVAAREVAGQRAAICEHCIAVAAEMLVQRARELKCKILQASAIAGIFKKEKEQHGTTDNAD